MQRDEVIAVLDAELAKKRFRDYAPNGLQVAGKENIQHVVTAVTASQTAINFAIAKKADALLVHHGYFWKGEAPEINGIKRHRLASLLRADINLIAYHLPLDQHPTLGNNILLGEALGMQDIHQDEKEPMLWLGDMPACSVHAFQDKVARELKHPVLTVGPQDVRLSRVAWCTGAAQDLLSVAAGAGADVFITGEYAERTFHEANELGITFFAAGHHATERLGVQALGRYLAVRYGLSCEFFDEANPF